jgi:riboflavin kinase / FMN adenylyltransferase
VITIKGQVGEGRKVGRTIGYPTINISYHGEDRGIFAGKVLIDGKFVSAAIHLGPRPTFDDEQPICEAFLLNWEEDVSAGTMVEIEAFKRIRNIKKFKKLADLKDQITKDVEFVKNWYNSTNK